MKQDTRGGKREHAYAYQLKVISSLVVDFSAKANFDNYIYLPYASVTAFFGEYEYLCKRTEAPLCASLTTFKRAYNALKEKQDRDHNIKVRLSGGSGKQCCYNFTFCVIYINIID